MKPICSIETSVSNHLTVSKNPQDESLQMQRGYKLLSPNESRPTLRVQLASQFKSLATSLCSPHVAFPYLPINTSVYAGYTYLKHKRNCFYLISRRFHKFSVCLSSMAKQRRKLSAWLCIFNGRHVGRGLELMQRSDIKFD
jgi:hypothetical protein